MSTVDSRDDDPPDPPPPRGLPGDRSGATSGAVLAKGHAVNLRHLTSRQVHETWSHRPSENLRAMPEVCDDVPPTWADLKDMDTACPECLAGKHTWSGRTDMQLTPANADVRASQTGPADLGADLRR